MWKKPAKGKEVTGQNDQVSEASFWQVQCIRRSKHQQLEWVSRVHILRCQ